MTTTRIYEDIDCTYKCVLLLPIDKSSNCAHKLKLPSFSLADVHFFTRIGDFKLCSNIHNSATQNNGHLLYTYLMIMVPKWHAKTTAFKFQTTIKQKQLTNFTMNISTAIIFKCSATLFCASGSYIFLNIVFCCHRFLIPGLLHVHVEDTADTPPTN